MTIQINREYTRVEILLPCGEDEEKAAAQAVIDFIRNVMIPGMIPGAKHHRYEGMTYSEISEPVFMGEWWDSRVKDWVPDEEAVLILDLILSYNSQQQVVKELGYLRNMVMQKYISYNAEQDEIWIIAHPIGRAIII